MKNIFKENTVHAIDFKLQLISSTVRILKYFCSAMYFAVIVDPKDGE